MRDQGHRNPQMLSVHMLLKQNESTSFQRKLLYGRHEIDLIRQTWEGGKEREAMLLEWKFYVASLAELLMLRSRDLKIRGLA